MILRNDFTILLTLFYIKMKLKKGGGELKTTPGGFCTVVNHIKE